MPEYKLKPSLLLFRLNLGLYGLSATVLLLYFPVDIISILFFCLVILLIVLECKYYRQKLIGPPELLSINLSSAVIELQLNQDNHQFSDYSVYTCRWGMILVLRNPECRKKLILLADRFDTTHKYLDLRFHLNRINQAIHAS